MESIYREFVTNYDRQAIAETNRKILRSLERWGYKLCPKIITQSRFAQKSNQLMKQFKKPNTWFIGADTYYAEIDHQSQYANYNSILTAMGLTACF